MKILVLTNLYPPLHAGTHDFRCQTVVENLRKRGHELRILTSSYGLNSEQRDQEIERRLLLNGVFGIPKTTALREVEAIDRHNHEVLRENIHAFQPEIVYVWSLSGLTKSLVFAIRRLLVPAVYDVADRWMVEELPRDVYLRWWNQKPTGLGHGLVRLLLELLGQRNRLDKRAPTRMMKGYDRQPVIYGKQVDFHHVVPNSVNGWPFEHVYFCSQLLRTEALRTGLQLDASEVIYPGLPSNKYFGDIKDESAPMDKYLVVTPLHGQSGVVTVLQAMRKLKEQGLKISLGVCGRGETEYVADIRSYAVRNNLPVEFLAVSDAIKDLPDIYRHHDAFIYSAEWEAPFATTPIQAMACGLPVIGSKIGGAREVFFNGRNAWVYAPGDVDDLVRAISELREQSALRKKMTEDAQAEVLGKFNEAAITDQIENFLLGAIEVWSQR